MTTERTPAEKLLCLAFLLMFIVMVAAAAWLCLAAFMCFYMGTLTWIAESTWFIIGLSCLAGADGIVIVLFKAFDVKV